MTLKLDPWAIALDRLDPPPGPEPEWRKTARDDQVRPDGDWRTWYVRGGRGGGKTWTGSNNFAEIITASEPGEWAVLAPTYGAARDTCIESADSGLIKALGGRCGPGGTLLDKGEHVDRWNRSMGQLYLRNGSVVYIDGADDGALRIQGKNLRGAWCDEVGLWIKWETAWSESLRYAVRLAPARIIATGTPKRSMPARALVKQLLADERIPKSLLRTADNADNLDAATLADLMDLAGTTLGRQELEGELLEEVEGAMWVQAQIDADRVDVAPALDRIVVAVDPAGSSSKDSDETGIVVAGRAGDHGFVLDDRSGRYTPDGWGRAVCLAYVDQEADAIVFERNNGHDMGPHILRSSWAALAREEQVEGPTPAIVDVWASRGKQTRAEPVVAQYEQHRWHHVGLLPKLEEQLTSWVPGEGSSPDRVDALVWAAFALTVRKRGGHGGLTVRDAHPPAAPPTGVVINPTEAPPARRGGMRVRAS